MDMYELANIYSPGRMSRPIMTVPIVICMISRNEPYHKILKLKNVLKLPDLPKKKCLCLNPCGFCRRSAKKN
jgi:hypothetical protein